MRIRKYNSNDYSAVLDIYAASKLDELRYEDKEFDFLPLEEDFKRLSKLKESDIYIYEDKNIMGYGAHFGSEIRALFVRPESRGNGIGKHLLEFLLSKITGSAELYVAKSNAPAKHLYKKYGFRIVKEFETSYNETPVFANKMVRNAANA